MYNNNNNNNNHTCGYIQSARYTLEIHSIFVFGDGVFRLVKFHTTTGRHSQVHDVSRLQSTCPTKWRLQLPMILQSATPCIR